jgi:hypothetical protein
MGEYGFEKMKKAQLVSLAYDFWRSIEKSKAEVERIRAEREDKVRAEIREEERKGWVETGLIMARDTIEAVLEDRELPFDLYYSLKYAMRDAVDSIDVASIVE